MAKKRGFNEKIITVINPLPKVDEATLMESAGLGMMQAEGKDAFAMVWKYGGTLETEIIRLPSGGSVQLRDSEAVDIKRDLGEQGIVLIEQDDDEKTKKRKTLAALQAAHRFWSERGNQKLIDQRKIHGYSAEEMEDRRYDHWPYYLAQAKADLIAEKIKSMSGAAQP